MSDGYNRLGWTILLLDDILTIILICIIIIIIIKLNGRGLAIIRVSKTTNLPRTQLYFSLIFRIEKSVIIAYMII